MNFLLFILLSLNTLHAEIVQTNTFEEVDKKVEELLKKYKPNEVIIVSDLDNTLLASTTALGSDQWYTWQSQLPPNDPKKIDDLMNVQGILFSLSKMKPTESNISNYVRNWQNKNIPFFILTSRGNDFRSYTERELNRNSIDPIISAPCNQGGFSRQFLPWGENRDSLSKNERVMLDVKNERPVSYLNGIFMSAGQHKGSMIRSLLFKCNLDPKAIVFIDDHERHVKRVEEAMNGTNIENVNFRYGKEDQKVNEFKESLQLQNKVTDEWRELNAVISRLF